jgi:GT2 family glycosyltransferase
VTGLSRPLITVVIPTHQRRDSLLRALAALARQDAVSAESIEVVVSIDRSTDGTAGAVEAFDAPYALRSVSGAGPGRAAACNAGIAAARADVILFLDDDMEPTPSCLARHLSQHPPRSRLCVMGAVPVRLDESSAPVEQYVAAKFDVHLAKLARSDHSFVLRDFYSGNASIRKDVLEEAGGFNESFTLYGNEDLELSVRLRAADVGLRYDAQAAAYQRYTKSFGDLARDTVEKGRTAVLLASTHPNTFADLQLAQFGARSTLWRTVRSPMLAAARRWPRSVTVALRVTQRLERAGAWKGPVFYAFVLDYFYWAGVGAALADFAPSGALGVLTTELRRGPLGLLLHR